MQFLAILDVLSDNRYEVCVGKNRSDVLNVWKMRGDIPRVRVMDATIVWPPTCPPLGGCIMYKVVRDELVVSERSFVVVGFLPVTSTPPIAHIMTKMTHSRNASMLGAHTTNGSKALQKLLMFMCVYLSTYNYTSVLEALKERQLVPDPVLDEEMDSANEPPKSRKRARVSTDVALVSIPTGNRRFPTFKCPAACVAFMYHVVRVDLIGMFGRYIPGISSFFEDPFASEQSVRIRWPELRDLAQFPWSSTRQMTLRDKRPTSAVSVAKSWLMATGSWIPAEVLFHNFPTTFPDINTTRRRAAACRRMNHLKEEVYRRWNCVQCVPGNERVLRAMRVGEYGPFPQKWSMVGPTDVCAKMYRIFHSIKDDAVIVPDGTGFDADGYHIVVKAHFATAKTLYSEWKQSKNANLKFALIGNPYHIGSAFGGIWDLLNRFTVPLLPASLLAEYTTIIVNDSRAAALFKSHSSTLAVSPLRAYTPADHLVDVTSLKAIGGDFFVTDAWDQRVLSTAMSCIPKGTKPTFFLFKSPWG